MIFHRWMTAFVAAGLATSACAAPAAQDDPMSDRLVRAADTLRDENFSGFVALAKDGEIIEFMAMGEAAPGRGYTPDTQFDVGSIAKPLTALAASQLIAEGRLDADATLADFFDDVPADKADIRVDQLLTHGAGLVEAVGPDREALSRDEFVERAMGSDLLFAPGTSYRYSNTGFSLVAAIVEEVTGKPFEDYLVQDVLGPIGLTSTGYAAVYDPVRVDADDEGRPVREASWGGHDEPGWNLVGNGGMVSSARDLARLGGLFQQGGLADGVAELMRRPLNDEGGGTHYGFGIVVEDHPQFGRVHWHNGGNPHFQTEWWMLDDAGLTLIVHRNGGPVRLERALGLALGAIAGEDVGVEAPVIAQGGPLPDGPAGALGQAFLDALANDDSAAWLALIDTWGSDGLKSQFSDEQHARMHGQLRQELGSLEFKGALLSDGRLDMLLGGENAPDVAVMLMLSGDEDQPRLNGIGIK